MALRCWKLVLLGSLLVGSSCTRGPERLYPPHIDAPAAGQGAIALYDQNGDGTLSSDELEEAPALKAALVDLDQNGDGQLTAQEIEARVKAWQATRASVLSASCTVTLDGEPLADAEVVLEPESFLGSEVKPAYGVTDATGRAVLSMAEEDRQDVEVPGVHCGLYLVRITKEASGRAVVPPQYNRETTLGAEVALDSHTPADRLRFDLQSQ